MRRNKVRGRDGAIRVVSFDYVLQDGEARVVELPFMDGRTMVHDRTRSTSRATTGLPVQRRQ
jgi:hypothetical protein